MMLDALSATSVVLDKCNERFALPLQLPGFYIVGLIAPGRFDLQRNLSLAIASAKGDKNFHQIFVDSFSADGTCENVNNHNFILDVLGIGGMKITLRSMSGAASCGRDDFREILTGKTIDEKSLPTHLVGPASSSSSRPSSSRRSSPRSSSAGASVPTASRSAGRRIGPGRAPEGAWTAA
jgi:hypothetical protein